VTWPWGAGVVLGLTLLVSGAAKLANRSWTTQAQALRIPHRVAVVVPVVEVVLGALLVADLGYPTVPLAAGGLLVAFTGFIVINLAVGRRPPCACFGAWSNRPIGPLSLVRNALLLVLAGIAAFG
jgi:uncharacterized membrane protein YphA (DoxX/SURF4 family)